MKEERKSRVFRKLEILLFAVYLAMLFYFLFFAESMGRTFSERVYHYNLEPFKEIRRFWTYRQSLGFLPVVLNLVGNVAAFFPFGAFLPVLFRRCRSFFLTVLLSFEFSLCVEIIQLIGKVGCFDVDDIFLNTLGGALGYLIYRFYRMAARRITSGGDNEKKKSL